MLLFFYIISDIINENKLGAVVLNNIEKSTILLTKCAIRNLKNQKFCFSDDELNKIYSFSKKHDIAHIVAYGLKINNALPKNDIGQKFSDAIYKAFFRYKQTSNTCSLIFGILESEGIDYLPLKGTVIREFYPEPWMRTSSDVDILIRKEDIDRTIEVITKQTDFKSELPSPYDVSLFSEKLHQHVELHFYLLDDRYEHMQKPVLDVWDFALKKDSNKCLYFLPDEYFLYFHYAHMAKHFKFMGFGIRLVLDTYIIKSNISFNYKSSKLFEIGKLFTFANAIDNLSNIWFGEQKSDTEYDDLSDYILESGIYGTTENKVNNINTSKLNYLLMRIFMPYNKMVFSYPLLRKHKILLPFCWLLRFFKIFRKGKTKSSLNEIKINFLNDEIKKEQIKQMLEKYELPQ